MGKNPLIRFEPATCPPGTLVRVWAGAFVGSPGIPPIDPETQLCRVDHWNSVGQVYVYRQAGLTAGGNAGMYVSASAIISKLPNPEGK